MTYTDAIATRNAALNARTALYNTGTIKIYSGTRPATPDTALSGNALLVTLTFGATAYGAAASGVATANAITSGVAAATGTASFARAFKSDGVTAIADLDCGIAASGKEIILDTLSIVTGATVSCSADTLSQP